MGLSVANLAVTSMNCNVDGKPFHFPADAIKSMGELIELIKSNIDPDKIITSFRIDGRVLEDNDWRSPLSIQAGKTLEIETGSRQSFIEERLSSASLYLDKIIAEYAQARMLFKSGDVQPANNCLGKAVKDMRAFVDWYQTILQMIANPPENEVKTFEDTVAVLTTICEQMLQQQLYRSWWAIGETLEKKLEPHLVQMKYACLAVFRVQGGASNQ